MIALVVRRVLWLVPVVLTVAVVTFVLMHQAPGGPWDSAKPIPASTRRNLDAKFGLDKPPWFNGSAVEAELDQGTANPLTLARAALDSRFFTYLGRIARFDFGPSYRSRGSEDVRDLILARFPVSLKLGLVAIAFAVVAGVPLGIAGALRERTWVDFAGAVVATVGVAVPTFVSWVVLLVFFSRHFGVAPVRRPEEWDGFGTAYLLPGVVLGLGLLAYLARLTRASLLEVTRQDYVRTARAKGLSEARVVRGHVLRNGLLPVLTVIGPSATELVTGSIIVEKIFGVPGLGREFVDAILGRDYTAIMGTALFYAVLIALANLAIDLAYGLADPRLRTSR